MARLILEGTAEGRVLVCEEGLSVWGGVEAGTGVIVDAHHPQRGESLAGRVVLMPTSRGSCSGSAVLLGLIMAGCGPAALVFHDPEEVLSLGALVAGRLFGRPLPVVRLDADDYARVARADRVAIEDARLEAGGLSLDLTQPGDTLTLDARDRALLAGDKGDAAQLAMRIVCDMARIQGASALLDVTRAHIDGCIYADPAFLTFARKMADLGARVRVPTTTNAISVDRENWRAQGVAPAFGTLAQALADAYVAMGAAPSFTCAPYLLADPPARGEVIAWSESNAVVHANSVLGARTAKHADMLDLCIALTGRAPAAGVYLDAGRVARRVVEVTMPPGADDAAWPLLGWLLGQASPDRVPLVRGLEHTRPGPDDLKALCAAFGTTSSAPLLHIAGVTPEGHSPPAADADRLQIGQADFARGWADLNRGGERVDLVAIGSPHASATECRALLAALGPRSCEGAQAMVTVGRDCLDHLRGDGTLAALGGRGVRVLPDLCWCSITEPVFPPSARVVMTNSAKYAHYGPGVSGREMRFASLADCADAAVTGWASGPPAWLERRG